MEWKKSISFRLKALEDTIYLCFDGNKDFSLKVLLISNVFLICKRKDYLLSKIPNTFANFKIITDKKYCSINYLFKSK